MRFIRSVTKLEQTELASMLGISQSTLSNWENGTFCGVTTEQRRILGELVQIGPWAVLDEIPRKEMNELERKFNDLVDQMLFIERRMSLHG